MQKIGNSDIVQATYGNISYSSQILKKIPAAQEYGFRMRLPYSKSLRSPSGWTERSDGFHGGQGPVSGRVSSPCSPPQAPDVSGSHRLPRSVPVCEGRPGTGRDRTRCPGGCGGPAPGLPGELASPGRWQTTVSSTSVTCSCWPAEEGKLAGPRATGRRHRRRGHPHFL